MRTYPALRLLLFLFCASTLPSADLAITSAGAYLSPETPAVMDAVILVHDGKITAAGSREGVRIPATATRLDFPGCYITAGFWNSHVHIITPALLTAKSAPVEQLNAQMDTMFNRWGFTSVFDIASVLENTLALRHRVNEGAVRGPRILTTGEPIWSQQPIYIQAFLAEHHLRMPVVESPAAAKQMVDFEIAHGADGTKLFTGSVQSSGTTNMPLAVASAAAAEAHYHHLPVFAHPQNSVGVDVAIQAGVDILAHIAPQAPDWTSEFVPRLMSAHMAVIPTLTLFDFEARKMNLPDREREDWIANAVGQLRSFSQAGGEVIFGTDIGYTDHFDTEMEFQLMSRAGMDYRAILASLTTTPARRFGFADRSGRLQAGLDADFVVLDGDPAKDVSALAKVKATIKSGKVIFRRQ